MGDSLDTASELTRWEARSDLEDAADRVISERSSGMSESIIAFVSPSSMGEL